MEKPKSRLRGPLRNLEDDVEAQKKKQLDQYLEDTRKNIDIVHYSILPQSRSHFKRHNFDVYEDEYTKQQPKITRGSRRQPKTPKTPAYTEAERQDMQREITLLSIQLNEGASRKSSRRALRSRSSRKGGINGGGDQADGGGSRMATASSFSAALPTEQIPTQEKLIARLTQRKAERGLNDLSKIPNRKDLTGIWGSRRLYLQKLGSKMFGDESGNYRSLNSRCNGIRQGIASAPPQFFARESTFSTITPRAKPPATAAATRPLTRKPTAPPPPTRGKLVILRDTTMINQTPVATKMTLEDIALPPSPHKRNRKVTYRMQDCRDSSPPDSNSKMSD